MGSAARQRGLLIPHACHHAEFLAPPREGGDLFSHYSYGIQHPSVHARIRARRPAPECLQLLQCAAPRIKAVEYGEVEIARILEAYVAAGPNFPQRLAMGSNWSAAKMMPITIISKMPSKTG